MGVKSGIRNDILEKKELIYEMIEKKFQLNEMCFILNCKYATLKRHLKLFNIEYIGVKSKFKGNNKKSVYDFLYYGSVINTHRLKLKLLEYGLKEHICELCGNIDWLGDVIPLELHHIDGDRYNNILNNLQLLCPNCHAKTDNYKSKNYKKIDKIDSIDRIDIIKNNFGKDIIENDKKEKRVVKIKKIRNKKTYNCSCGNFISRGAKQCLNCYHKALMRVIRPPLDILLKEVEDVGYCAVARKYGVSDNTIVKWIKRYKE